MVKKGNGYKDRTGEKYGRLTIIRDSEGWAAMAILLGLVMLIIVSVMIITGIPRLLNPEYFALMDLKP